MSAPESKTCAKCGETKPLSEYYFEKGKPRGSCKACHRAVVYLRSPERRREIDNASRAKNRERIRERDRKLRAERGAEFNRRRRYARALQPKPPRRKPDPAKRAARLAWKRAYNKRYYAANTERFEIYRRRREALKAQVRFEPYTRREIYNRDEGICKGCRKALPFKPNGFQIDHIVPISLGGPDTPANVQLMCGPCNRRKWATLDGQIHFAV
jgi:5-methylcytosine-specific restriction endonuclease McrA